MPPVPQHGATGPEQHHELPGVMMGEQGVSSGLQTHSSKFPIEREVILTSGVEKSSATFKARLLPELRGPGGPGATSRLQPVHSPRGQHRAAPASIAPDAPARHLAWTPDSTPKHRVSVDAEQLILTRVHAETSYAEDELAHQRAVYKAHALHEMPRGHGPPQDPHGVYVRSPYMPGGPENPYMYTTHTGAVPRGWPGPRGDDGSSQDPRSLYSPPTRPRPSIPQPGPSQQQQQQQQPHMNGHGEPRAPAPAPRTAEQEPPPHRPPPIPAEQEESKPTTNPPPKNFPAKTYHTIKDMISTRFGGKGAPGDCESGGMNNSRQSQLRASGKSLKSEGESLQPALSQQQTPQHQQSQQQQQQQSASNYSGQQQHQYMHHHHPPPQTRTPASRFQESQLSGGQQSPDEGGFTQAYSRQSAEGKSEAEGEYYYARAAPDHGSLYVAMRYQQQQQQHLQNQQMQQQQQQQQQQTSSAPEPEPRSRPTIPSPAREAGDGGGRASGGSSDYEKATHSSGSAAHTTDSGRGPSLPPPGQRELPRLDTSTESSDLSPQSRSFGISQSAESEWVDLVESELRQILEPRLLGPHLHAGSGPPPAVVPRHGANSALSESVGSMTPPLPPLSPSGSPCGSPKLRHYKLQPNSSGQGGSSSKAKSGSAGVKMSNARGPTNAGNSSTQRGGWSASRSKGPAPIPSDNKQRGLSSKQKDQGKGKMVLSALHTFGPPDSAAELTSTTTGLDLDSVLDGQTENTSDDEEDDDLSTTVDATDAQAIRRQLEGLENMYSEVLKMLGVKKYGTGGRYLPGSGGGTTGGRRRLYGSLSSLPSSVSSRPVRERRGRQDDRKRVKDVKGINKRFQRLESHVVTLARSVAHLSSEMRTQHLMIQEMENIRGEIAQLRASQTPRSHSVPRLSAAARSGSHEQNNSGGISGTQSTRIKKLTKFFGDEPPLLRLFLRKLGYEKYANNFEQEKVGLMELPYMSEDRLQKMGIPMGPRLRILQEAQAAAACGEGFSVYVV